MATQMILNYGVNFLQDNVTTYIRCQLANGRWHTLKLSDNVRAGLVIDTLRNERPVFLVEETGVIFTGKEPVGEGDTDTSN